MLVVISKSSFNLFEKYFKLFNCQTKFNYTINLNISFKKLILNNYFTFIALFCRHKNLYNKRSINMK